MQCNVFAIGEDGNEGKCIFKGINVVIKEQREERGPVSRVTRELEMTGVYTKNGHTHDFRDVAFHIQYQRVNVIEILKHGQFIKFNGRGYVSTFTFPNASDSVVVLVIQVKGEITQV